MDCSECSAAELGRRLEYWAAGNAGRDEDVQLVFLLRWPEWPAGSQKVPAREWEKAMSKVGHGLGG